MTRVLVVEDEKNLREPLVYLLQKEGYDVIEAEDGHVSLWLLLLGGKRPRCFDWRDADTHALLL